jgi:hypothetical protein
MAVALGIAFLVALRHPGGRPGVTENVDVSDGHVPQPAPPAGPPM